MPWLHVDHRGPALHAGPGRPCGLQQRFLHGRMVEGQRAGLMQRGADQITAIAGRRAERGGPVTYLTRAGQHGGQQPQRAGLSHSPGMNPLAAHAILEGPLAFQDQDFDAVRGQNGGQRRAGDAAADHDHIIGHVKPPRQPLRLTGASARFTGFLILSHAPC